VEFENLNGKIEMNAPLFARYCGIDIGKYYATIHGKNFTVELEGTGIVTPDTLDEKEEEKKEMNSPTEIGTWFMAPAMAPNKPRNEFLGIKGTITYIPWVSLHQKPVSTVPLKGVIVKLYILDESKYKYKYIGKTNTGMDGKFYFTQTIPSESKVKLVIKLEDAYGGKSRVKVISNSTHKPYEKVVEYRIAEKGRDIYIPIEKPTKWRKKYDEHLFHGAVSIYDTIWMAHSTFKRLTGKNDMHRIDVKYPAKGTYYWWFNNDIYIQEGAAWDKYTIRHEYGHAVADRYGFSDISAGGEHGGHTSPKLAFSEGFADFFETVIKKEEDNVLNIYNWKPEDEENGDVEDAVTATLWDLYDDDNKDDIDKKGNRHDFLTYPFWTIFKDLCKLKGWFKEKTIYSLYNVLIKEHSGHQRLIEDIYKWNGINPTK
ncbi:MAG: hypothetical protein AB1779_12090, partial [Candidatus Thermoplasmatota archaeon]